MKWLLSVVFMMFIGSGIYASDRGEAIAGAFKEAFLQILTVDEYAKIVSGSEMDKINEEIKKLEEKGGAGNEKKIEKLNKKLDEILIKAERDLTRRTAMVEAAAKNITSGKPQTYGSLISAINENVDFIVNNQSKVMRQLEKKKKDLDSRINREKSKLEEAALTELQNEVKEFESEIQAKKDLIGKLRKSQQKVNADKMREFLSEFSAVAKGQSKED